MNPTTIKVSKELKDYLESCKLYPRESYQDVIWAMIEKLAPGTRESESEGEPSTQEQ